MTTVHWARCTICHSTSEASLNFTSKCEINVLLVVHSILWRQERQQQQTGNEERVSEGKMIKIEEAETDVRGKNWDQTDNDSETVVENTEVKTTVELWRSTKRNFLQEGPRKLSKWDVHNCTPGISCNETNSNWIDQLWVWEYFKFRPSLHKLYLWLHKRIAKATWPSKAASVYVKETARVQDKDACFF